MWKEHECDQMQDGAQIIVELGKWCLNINHYPGEGGSVDIVWCPFCGEKMEDL